MVNKLKVYTVNLLIAVDQLFNAVFAGDPDETISSRMGKWKRLPKTTWQYKIAHAVCLILHRLDRNHCDDAIEHDEGKDDLIQTKK